MPKTNPSCGMRDGSGRCCRLSGRRANVQREEINHGCTRMRLTHVRRCWGAQRIEAEGVLGADFQQILSGDDGVEKAVAIDAAVKVAEVDEYGPDGHVVTDVQSLHFARDLFLDFAPDFVLALRFDDIGRAGRLDQEIDQTAAAARVALVAIGSSGDDDAVAKVQVGENLPEMVDDQVLELKTHRRMPVRKRFQGCESVGSVFDFHGMGFNVLEIEPCVVVADAVSSDAGDFLLAGADAGRNENRAALGLVEQGFALSGDFVGGEPPRALDLQAVGLVEQEGVAVGRVGTALDLGRIEAGEEVGVAANDRESLRVRSNVVDENLKLAAAKENVVVVALGEELGGWCGGGAIYGTCTGRPPVGQERPIGLGAADLEAPDDLAEMAGHALANEEQPVEVVGHDGAFDERDLEMEARDLPPAVGDGPAQLAQFDALADQLAENRSTTFDFKRNHVDAALVVVVAEAAALHRMDFGFHTHIEDSLKRLQA